GPGGAPLLCVWARGGGGASGWGGGGGGGGGAPPAPPPPPPERIGIETVCDQIAERIAAHRTGPFLLFGHSLGALIAFEVARRLGDRPAHLIASGCAAPALHPTPRMVEVAGLDGQSLTEAVALYGGMRPEIVADPELQEFILPDVRADFRMVAEYRYRPAAALPFGISLVNGVDDPMVRRDDLADWSRECAVAPEMHWSEGGHFYFEQHPEAVTDVIRRAAEALPVELI
ncbi:thioesterase II family protein, partial [Streptomyces inhibens]|uniref:thioesterase II family protein n=1 Tax=Streptomyces inhibens TaxID=2293571 RepID=UPI0036884CA3